MCLMRALIVVDMARMGQQKFTVREHVLACLRPLFVLSETAKSDAYLWIGGPLLCGLGVLIATSIAPIDR